MKKILVADGMEEKAVGKLKNKGYEVIEKHYDKDELEEKIKNVDVLIVRSATKVRREIIDKALEGGKLKLIIRGGVGVDNIDVDYAKEKGIKVANTPNASSASVAELTIAHMFAISRHINEANVTMREGKWEKKKYQGIELNGKILGLIGFGRIAREVAKRAYALGMNIIYTDICGEFNGFDYCKFCSQEELLKTADFVSLHIPLCKGEGAVIGKKEIDMMKDGAYLINCARGGVVDEDALIEALESNKLAGACLDVFESEPSVNPKLVNHPNVSLTPHIGASTVEAQTRIGNEIVEIVEEFYA